MQLTVKRIILGSIVFMLGLVTLLALNLPVIRISINNILKLTATGFSLIRFENQLTDGYLSVVGGVFCILQLIFGVCSMLFTAISVFCFSKSTAKCVFSVLAVMNMVFLFLYMLLGIITVAVVEQEYLADPYYSYNYYNISTLTLVAFFIGIFLFAAYLTCNYFLKSTSIHISRTANIQNQTPKPATLNAGNSGMLEADRAATIVATLKQYKELPDADIITYKEFEKKKELLNREKRLYF